jgi:hypothetical protein
VDAPQLSRHETDSSLPSSCGIPFSASPASGATTVQLAGGDRLSGTITARDETSLTLQNEFLGTVKIRSPPSRA